MTAVGNIPIVRKDCREAMNEWCREMVNGGLLLHLDDLPDSIENIYTGAWLFSSDDCRQLDGILDRFAEHYRAALHGACLYHTQRHLRIPPG